LAQKREAQRIEEQAAEAVRRALPAEFVAELEGRDLEARKRKRIEGTFGLDGYEPPDEVWYARNRELEEAEEMRKLEPPGEPYLVESAPAAQQPEDDNDEGILSRSTLAALKGFTGVSIRTEPKSQSRVGPLVAYDSDDEGE
jgi:hypothetical protein